MNLFRLSLRFNKFPIAEATEHFKAIEAISEKEFDAHIDKRKKAILDFHLNNNPFYKNLTRNIDTAQWEQIPVLTKAHLQQPLSQRLSNGYSVKGVYVNKTSGSSGHPFVFAKDKFCHALTWARVEALYKQHGIVLGKSLEARFYGIPLDFIGHKKESLKDRLSRRRRFPIFDLSDQKMANFLARFKNTKFELINGYTSSIVLFAKYLAAQNIVLTTVCPTLRHCIVTSEMLFDSDKELLEKWLGVPIINEYGASELGVMGYTNKEGEFALNAETLYIEILDDENRLLPEGEVGRIVVTSLYNKAHPMIRYDIGDYGIIAPHGTAKRKVLHQLVGRTNDVAELKNGTKVPGLTFYYVTKSVIEDDGNVKEFIVEQLDYSTFKVIYVAEDRLNEKKHKQIKEALDTYVGEDLEISFERVEVLIRSNRGKLKQFVKRF